MQMISSLRPGPPHYHATAWPMLDHRRQFQACASTHLAAPFPAHDMVIVFPISSPHPARLLARRDAQEFARCWVEFQARAPARLTAIEPTEDGIARVFLSNRHAITRARFDTPPIAHLFQAGTPMPCSL